MPTRFPRVVLEETNSNDRWTEYAYPQESTEVRSLTLLARMATFARRTIMRQVVGPHMWSFFLQPSTPSIVEHRARREARSAN